MQLSIELIGLVAAFMTTFAWLPQIMKIFRDRRAGDISLMTNSALAVGIILWIVYGIALGSWPVILANSMTLVFVVTIIGLKLRYG